MCKQLRPALLGCALAVAMPAIMAQGATEESLLRRIESLERNALDREARIGELEIELRDRDAADHLEPQLVNLRESLETASPAVTTRGDTRLQLSAQVRIRGEYRNVKNYGAAVVDESADFVIQRTRVNFDFRASDDVRAFVQLQDARRWGEAGSALGDLEGVDVHQAFVDFENVFGAPVTIRVGRQELSYGDQRLVSPLDWSPVGNSFDGVKAWWSGDGFQLDAFATYLDEQSLAFGNAVGDDDLFAGLYLQVLSIENHELDAYVFYRSFEAGNITNEAGEAGDLHDATIGLRFAGATGGLDYSAEIVLQVGDRAGDDVEAYAWAVTVGYTFDHPARIRIGLEWDFATGDDELGDGDFNTFDPLFAFIHAYQGYLDIFAWQNGHDIALHLSGDVTEGLRATLSVHAFILDSDRDGWFAANGRAQRRVVAGGVDNYVGLELDLSFRYAITPETAAWFGYSHFFAGDYVEETGAHPDSDWLFVQLTVAF